MAISKLGGTGSDNWELISSVTPTAATSSVNFTGLSPYRKLMIKGKAITQSFNVVSIRLNNDSGTNYDFSVSNYNSGTGVLINTVAGGQTSFSIHNASSAADHYDIVIENCDNAGLKFFTYGLYVDGTNSVHRREYWGVYAGSAIVSQVNIVGTGTFSGGGTMSLYGVK